MHTLVKIHGRLEFKGRATWQTLTARLYEAVTEVSRILDTPWLACFHIKQASIVHTTAVYKRKQTRIEVALTERAAVLWATLAFW